MLVRALHGGGLGRAELHVLEGRVLEEKHLVLVPNPDHVQVVGVLPLLAPEQQPLLPGLQPRHHRQHNLQLTCNGFSWTGVRH
jgi:hypothetical protein